MEKGAYYSILTRRFILRSRHGDWFEETQRLYNEVLQFYYRLFLKQQELPAQNRQAARLLETLTIVGRDGQPALYPLPWGKIPLYFRRAAINAAIAAGRSSLSREEWEKEVQFHKSVTFYKGMYKDFTEKGITLKLWTGETWRWTRCNLHGNQTPVGAEQLSPSVVIREHCLFLDVPVRETVPDGRKAKERMAAGCRICAVQFSNEDALAVCAVLDAEGALQGFRYLKGGARYAESCRRIEEKIAKSQRSTGGEDNNWSNKRHWEKLKNISDYFSNSISRQVINIMIEENAEILIMPKYEDMYQRRVMKTVGNWSPLHLSYRIRDQLFYKSWNKGILVLEVDVCDAGGVCSVCGGAVRKDGRQFFCENGHQGNRSLNMAINIGRKCQESFRKHAP